MTAFPPPPPFPRYPYPGYTEEEDKAELFRVFKAENGYIVDCGGKSFVFEKAEGVTKWVANQLRSEIS